MKLRIWPPVWLTFMAILAFFTDHLLPGLRLPGSPFYLAGPILWVPALWLFWHAHHTFVSARTPPTPSDSLQPSLSEAPTPRAEIPCTLWPSWS